MDGTHVQAPLHCVITSVVSPVLLSPGLCGLHHTICATVLPVAMSEGISAASNEDSIPATTATATTTAESDKGLFGQLLVPGSSLHPTFLLVLDGAFGLLLCVFLGLLFLTGGNGHLFALIGLEGCLWASVKW